jgi:hypothetical protein
MRPEMKGFANGQIGGAPRRRRPRRLSELFAQLSRDARGQVSIAHIRDALGDRSFAPLLVIFAAFNLLPLPPGASAFLGLPLVIVSAQMVWGRRQAWLPAFLMNRSLSAAQFRRVMDWLVPRLNRLERVVRPRYWPFWRRQGDRVIGVIALVLSIVVTLPIPLGNWLPAFATALLGLALSERDGILFAIGGALGVASMIVIAAVIGAAGLATEAVFGWLLWREPPRRRCGSAYAVVIPAAPKLGKRDQPSSIRRGGSHHTIVIPGRSEAESRGTMPYLSGRAPAAQKFGSAIVLP